MADYRYGEQGSAFRKASSHLKDDLQAALGLPKFKQIADGRRTVCITPLTPCLWIGLTDYADSAAASSWRSQD
ncbi:MAG: hypothetical protein DWQ01_00855 [Planctomycetota bacterium]|nr:MAG: hypothetical protein DWQ01_00855 [Planctomycetota bacterium]